MHAAVDEELSYLSGDWRIFQKRRGHRWSLDDLVTAHFAVRACRDAGLVPSLCVDLGCGIGSVLLMLAWSFPNARAVGVEAQAVSVGLAKKSIAYNGVGHRVEVREGDLRTTALPSAALVTGTPPYFPLGTAVVPDRPQAAGALFELRGGPEDYVCAAADLLEPQGLWVLCASALQEERVFASLRSHAFHVAQFQRVVPRHGKAPLLGLWAARKERCDTQVLPPLVVRDATGQWTEEFSWVRADMGLPPRAPSATRPNSKGATP